MSVWWCMLWCKTHPSLRLPVQYIKCRSAPELLYHSHCRTVLFIAMKLTSLILLWALSSTGNSTFYHSGSNWKIVKSKSYSKKNKIDLRSKFKSLFPNKPDNMPYLNLIFCFSLEILLVNQCGNVSISPNYFTKLIMSNSY